MAGKPETKNISESVRARLLNIAKAANRNFDAVLLQYFQERFLYRLSQSQHREKYILKGALLLFIKSGPETRPTKDIDFLGTVLFHEETKLIQFIQEIGLIQVEDGVRFDVENMVVEKITEQNDYHGYRIKFPAYLGVIRKVLQLDIGLGDVIVAGPIEMNFPTILDFGIPWIQVYSFESMIAEKFQAIVRFNILTSRMKDFYDILFIAQHHEFKLSILNKAIRATFKNRQTSPGDRAKVFNEKFKLSDEKQEQWQAFLNRNRLSSVRDFSKVVDLLKAFIEPVFTFQKEIDKDLRWCEKPWKWI